MSTLYPKVDWRTGDVLTTQHLQAQDRYLESLLGFQLKSSSLPAWGLLSLKIDADSLKDGIFVLSEARGILPDGLAFDIPFSDPIPAGVFKEYHGQADKRLSVRLAICADRNQDQYIAAHDAERIHDQPTGTIPKSRYLTSDVDIQDENDSESIRTVRMLRKNLSLLFIPEPLNGGPRQDLTTDLISIEIARLLPDSQDTFVLDQNFIPAILDVSACNYLTQVIGADVLRRITSQSSKVADVFQPVRTVDVSTMNAVEIGSLSYLVALNSSLPLIRNFCETIDGSSGKGRPGGHPKELYNVLSSLACALTTFSAVDTPSSVPRYLQDDLTKTFQELHALLRRLLSMDVLGKFLLFRLKPVPAQPRIVQTDPIDAQHLGGSKIYVAVRGRDKKGDNSLAGKDLRDIEFSWVPSGATSQLAFANPLRVGQKEEPDFLRKRHHSYYAILAPGPIELTRDTRLQARWRETWSEINLELVIIPT